MKHLQYARQEETKKTPVVDGHWAYPLLGEEHGCTNECATGISYYTLPDYTPPAEHPFQEGFFVVRGTGMALVDGTEITLDPELSFLVPAHAQHSLKCCGEEPLVLFWFHAQG